MSWTNDPILSVDGLVKRFGGNVAVNGREATPPAANGPATSGSASGQSPVARTTKVSAQLLVFVTCNVALTTAPGSV